MKKFGLMVRDHYTDWVLVEETDWYMADDTYLPSSRNMQSMWFDTFEELVDRFPGLMDDRRLIERLVANGVI